MKQIFTLFLLSGAIAAHAQSAQLMTFQPGPTSAFETVVSSPYPANGGPAASIVAAAWTANSVHGAWRSYFRMDMSALPDGAIIDSARLSLYADMNSVFGIKGQPTIGSDNAATIYRTTAAWNNSTTNWNTKAAYDTTGAAILAQATNDHSDYTGINVTTLVQDMHAFGNYGFMMKMNQEDVHYNSLIFYSASSGEATKRPKLDVYFHTLQAQSITGNNAVANSWIIIYPNPAHGNVQVKLSAADKAQYSITDVTGKVIRVGAISGKEATISLKDIATGTYFLRMQSGVQQHTQPLVIE